MEIRPASRGAPDEPGAHRLAPQYTGCHQDLIGLRRRRPPFNLACTGEQTRELD